MNLYNWTKFYIDNVLKAKIKIKTFDCYTFILEKHIKPTIGNIELEDLSYITLQKFINDLKESGNLKNKHELSTGTIRLIFSLIKQALLHAEKIGIYKNEHLSLVSLPKGHPAEIYPFTISEQNKIINFCLSSNKPNYIGIVICFYTGIRIGELLSLRWDDIDFRQRLIRITHTQVLTQKNGKHIYLLDNPKSLSSKRLIPMNDLICMKLKLMKSKSESRYIICTKSQNMVSVRSYQRTFKSILNKLIIPSRGFHSIRHTFITRALECGIDPKTTSKIAGHSNVNITLNKYTHISFENEVKAIKKIYRSYKPYNQNNY